MSDVKRKPGPLRKSEVIQKAHELGLGELDILGLCTVAELNKMISDANNGASQYDEEAEAVARVSIDCGHNDFRNIIEIHSSGNKRFKLCKQCGYKEAVK